MIHDKRLEEKHIIKPEIVLEMIQLITGLRDFHFTILKINFGIQEAISPYSLNEISLSNTSWTQKSIWKRKKVRDSRIEMSKQFHYSINARMLYIVKEYM